MRKSSALEVINGSVNQTLARTLMTSLTTLLVLLALFFVGGEVIHSFALALIVGVVSRNLFVDLYRKFDVDRAESIFCRFDAG